MFAQSDPALDKLIRAENAFATASQAPGAVKAGFLSVLDSASLVVDDGRANPAIAVYCTFPDTGSFTLHWWPVVAAVSADGQIGYTSGPFVAMNPAHEREPASRATGYYLTVWKQNNKQVFRLMLDGGLVIQNNWDSSRPHLMDGSGLQRSYKKARGVASFNKALDAFAAAVAIDAPKAYQAYVADQPWLLRNDRSPVSDRHTALQQIENGTMETTEEHRVLASSRDFGYSYGQSGKKYFVRIWIYENDHWKILAELLSA